MKLWKVHGSFQFKKFFTIQSDFQEIHSYHNFMGSMLILFIPILSKGLKHRWRHTIITICLLSVMRWAVEVSWRFFHCNGWHRVILILQYVSELQMSVSNCITEHLNRIIIVYCEDKLSSHQLVEGKQKPPPPRARVAFGGGLCVCLLFNYLN